MKIVFCSTCKGRVQHIEQTLPRNLADNAAFPDCKFVLVDYCDPGPLRQYLRERHRCDIESGRLAVYSYFGDRIHEGPLKWRERPFQMAHAKNLAHRLAILEGGDILVNLDADNFTGKGFAAWIAEQYGAAGDTDQNLFLWAKMQYGENKLPRGISGRIVVPSSAFMKLGGYDEKYTTWAPDDKDFNTRLRRLGYTAQEIPRQYLGAVLHNDKMRFREYQHVAQSAKGEDNSEEVNEADTTVCNYGHFGEGVVFKNFGGESITLGPLPTRVFGIGMHKTATTSLHHALRILGFDSAHWKSAHWAKAIWEEMNAWGRSITLEHHYALSDLPIGMLYEKLDKGYPGSQFILTVRDENRWLKSVERHWSYDHNKFRGTWSTDPFTHKLHKAVYGQKGFDAEIFLARYRRHNTEVIEYFKDRPGDLLLMNMDSALSRWEPLCRFLDRPVPAVDYPREYETQRSN